MADNFAVTSGTGTTLATRESGGVHTMKKYVANGDDVTQGAIADAAVINPGASGSVVALLKGLLSVQQGDVIEFTPTLDTGGYTSGDVLFATTAVAGVFPYTGGRATLDSICILDKDDNGIEMDLVFLRANSALGTFNSPPDIDDTEAEDVLGIVNIPAANYVDLGANKVATVRNIGLVLEPTTGTTLYVAGIIRGTPTYTASGLKFKLGLRWN